MIQWGSPIFATMVLYKLSIGVASIPEWNPEIARSFVPLETYLETCCQLMSDATSTSASDHGEQGTDLFSLMASIWTNVKDSYLRLRRMPWEEAVADRGEVHAINFSGMSPSGNGFSSYAAARHPILRYMTIVWLGACVASHCSSRCVQS